MLLLHRLLQYDVKKTLVAVASCNTTCKKISSSLLLIRMTIKNEVVAVCPRYTTCTGLLFAISRGHCLLARNTMKILYYCCSLIAVRHKNTIVIVIACNASSLHTRNMTVKNINVVDSCNTTKICSHEQWHKSRMVT